eukprot:7478858-Pyramimonas_sp.AAC.1
MYDTCEWVRTSRASRHAGPMALIGHAAPPPMHDPRASELKVAPASRAQLSATASGKVPRGGHQQDEPAC